MTPTKAWPPKEVHEHLDYGADFRDDLLLGESATDFTAVVQSGSITITSSTQANGFVTIWISGGTKGELASVRVTLTTSEDRIFTMTPVLPIV